MKIKLYQVDAFAEKLFTGNPAAVCPLGGEWLDAAVMQKIAMENNLAETAFYVLRSGKYHIRWFTPETEVDLCGHATMASAHVLFNHEGFFGAKIVFGSRSGDLSVTREGDLLALNFPPDVYRKTKLTKQLLACFKQKPLEAYKGKTDYMLVFRSEAQVKDVKPDFAAINKIPARGMIVTAPGTAADFVSRFFAPQSGIFEGSATGSSHTTLAPYWGKVLGKTEMTALQLSPRTGSMQCRLRDGRVVILGKAVTYLRGEIEI